MRKFVVGLLFAAAVAGNSFADPIGLSLGIDGFALGDFNSDEDFSSKASITPRVQLDRDITKTVNIFAYADTLVPFDFDVQSAWLDAAARLKLGFPAGAAGKLEVPVLFKAAIPLNDVAETVIDGEDAALSIIPQVRYTRAFDFGSAYASLGLDVTICGDSVFVSTGADALPVSAGSSSAPDSDNFRLGVQTNMGLYTYAEFALLFYQGYDGDSVDIDDYLTNFKFCMGFNNMPGRKADVSLKVNIPTVEDGVKNQGFSITARGEDSDILPKVFPGLGLYIDIAVSGLGNDSDAVDVGVSPTIGVAYSF